MPALKMTLTVTLGLYLISAIDVESSGIFPIVALSSRRQKAEDNLLACAKGTVSGNESSVIVRSVLDKRDCWPCLFSFDANSSAGLSESEREDEGVII